MDNNTVLLKQIISEGFNKRIDDVLNERMESIECSKKHSEVMRAIVEGRVTGNVVWTVKMRRVVAILVAALLLLTGCAVAYHSEIFGFFRDEDDIAVHLTPNNKDGKDEPLKNIEQIYELSYLPEGYTLRESLNLIITIRNVYVDENGNEMIFMQMIAGTGDGSVSNENTVINYHIIGNHEVVEVIASPSCIYIWHDGVYKMNLVFPEQLSVEQLEMIINGIVAK